MMRSKLTQEDANTIQRVLNLTKHPMFHEQPDLFAWEPALEALNHVLEDADIV